MVVEILNNAPNIVRTFTTNSISENINVNIARLVVLSGTTYDKQFSNFAFKMNALLPSHVKVEIVKATASPLSRLLFRNSANCGETEGCVSHSCFICRKGMYKGNSLITSTITNLSSKTDKRLNCNNGGIYVVTGGCDQQYTGKTTTPYSNRTYEHFCKCKSSAIYTHQRNCDKCVNGDDCSVVFVENYLNRGEIYSFWERVPLELKNKRNFEYSKNSEGLILFWLFLLVYFWI